jgi:hypothetical protein
MLRLILQSVEISENNGQCQATVTLQNGETQLVGTADLTSTNDEFVIVAQATLNAVRQALPSNIDLDLDKAAPIKHDSIDKNLLVVTIDYNTNGKSVQLTGTCLSNDEKATHNIAKATLDATNRLVAYLSENEGKEF